MCRVVGPFRDCDSLQRSLLSFATRSNSRLGATTDERRGFAGNDLRRLRLRNKNIFFRVYISDLGAMEVFDSDDSIPVKRHRDYVHRAEKNGMPKVGSGETSPIQLLVNKDVLPENTWTES